MEKFCVICKLNGELVKGTVDKVHAHIVKEHSKKDDHKILREMVSVRQDTEIKDKAARLQALRLDLDDVATHYMATVGLDYVDKTTGTVHQYKEEPAATGRRTTARR